MRWTLEDALRYIRALQPVAMEAGWCILLGGGVLNKGWSDSDLDLLAYPRVADSSVEDLLEVLPAGDWSLTPVSSVLSYRNEGRLVELIFQTMSVDI